MAIMHAPMQVIGRNKGRSSVASAAYRSGTKMTNEYDGLSHDFRYKTGVGHTEILLPSYVPDSFLNRDFLWNSVEKSERAKDAQLAREIEISIPHEIPDDRIIEFARELVEEIFVSEGMIADVCHHAREHGYDGNPNKHIHVMMPMRPVDNEGEFMAKSEQLYCLKNEEGEEKSFTTSELKDMDEEEKSHWQKQYHYSINGNPKGKKIWLTEYEQQHNPEFKNYKRIKGDRQPKTEKFGRQNPFCERWNSLNFLLDVREKIADKINSEMAAMGLAVRVDHRSYAEQGLDIEATVHEGPAVTAMKRRGITTEVGTLNDDIRERNHRLKELDAELEKLHVEYDELLNSDEYKAEKYIELFISKKSENEIYNANVEVIKDFVTENPHMDKLSLAKFINKALKTERVIRFDYDEKERTFRVSYISLENYQEIKAAGQQTEQPVVAAVDINLLFAALKKREDCYREWQENKNKIFSNEPIDYDALNAPYVAQNALNAMLKEFDIVRKLEGEISVLYRPVEPKGLFISRRKKEEYETKLKSYFSKKDDLEKAIIDSRTSLKESFSVLEKYMKPEELIRPGRGYDASKIDPLTMDAGDMAGFARKVQFRINSSHDGLKVIANRTQLLINYTNAAELSKMKFDEAQRECGEILALVPDDEREAMEAKLLEFYNEEIQKGGRTDDAKRQKESQNQER